MSDVYFSGQGIVYVGDRDSAGVVKTFRDVGNVPALRVALTTDVIEHKESRSGRRLIDFRLTRENRARVTMTMEDFSKENMMLLMYGTDVDVTASTVTAELFGSGLVVGDVVATIHPDISAIVVKDSTGSPLTLVLNTDYSVVDAKAGLIKILNLGSYVQPFKIDYSYAAQDVVPFFTAPQKERFLRFVGLNTANSDKRVVIDIYRVIFDPVGNLDLISDDLNKFEIEGSALYDSTRAADATLGGFGRVMATTPFHP